MIKRSTCAASAKNWPSLLASRPSCFSLRFSPSSFFLSFSSTSNFSFSSNFSSTSTFSSLFIGKLPMPMSFFKNSKRTDDRGLVPMSASMYSPATCCVDHSPARMDCLANEHLKRKWRVRQFPPSLAKMACADMLSVFTSLEIFGNSSARMTKIDSPAIIPSTISVSSASAVLSVTNPCLPDRQKMGVAPNITMKDP